MISVVIPTLNAAGSLASTLESLQAGVDDGLVVEIVVSDGGSTDGTLEAAQRFGCTVVIGEPGRGGQLARGAAAAHAPWLLFLHADTCLSPHWPAAAKAFTRRRDSLERGAVFRFALDDDARSARMLERIVAWRGRWLGLPYGDQGFLISRHRYDVIGGYRPMPLMEDVDLIRRLGRGRIEILDAHAVTSAVRYRRDGYGRRMLRNVACLTLFFIGLPPRTIARLYG